MKNNLQLLQIASLVRQHRALLADILKFVLVSILIGATLSIAGITRLDMMVFALQLWRSIQDMNVLVIPALFEFMLKGAIITLPIWLVWRCLTRLKGDMASKD